MEKKEKKEKKESKDKKEKNEKKDKKEKDKKERKDSKGGSDDKHKRDALLTATWSVPTILPGPSSGPIDQTSLSPPELSLFTDNNIYLSFRASSNDAIWVNYSSNGQTWLGSNSYVVKKGLATAEEEEQPPGPAIDTKVYTLFRPAMTTYSGFLYLAFTNKVDSNIVIMRSSNPTTSLWTFIGNVPIPALASSGPSIAAFNNGLLYLAYTDVTNKIQVGNFNLSTNTWSTFTTVKDSGGSDYKTIDGPCLWTVTSGSINYRVYICFRSVNITYIGYANLDSNGNITSWTPQTTAIVAPFSIIDTPQVAQYNNTFYMALPGPKNNDIKVGSSADEGATWGTWTTIDNSSNGSPTIVQFGSQLNMSFSSISQTPSRAFVMTTYATFS